MKTKSTLPKYFPRTNVNFYILLALFSPQDGHGIMNMVEEISEGDVRLAPGTLYGVLHKLEKDGLISKYDQLTSDRRHLYELTALGRNIVQEELHKLQSLIDKYNKMLQ